MEHGTLETLSRTLRHPDPLQLRYELEEIVERRTYLQHGVAVRPGDLVLDAGANVGAAAAFFATECGAGQVHCFEPVRPIFEVLRENLSGFPACVAHPYGLASEAGRASITFYPSNWAMSGLNADPEADRAEVRAAMLNMGKTADEIEAELSGRFATETLDCELRTLSDALRSEAIERVDLLKIDVEGAERDLLDGIDEGDWPRIRQVAAEVHRGGEHLSGIVAALEGRGFRVAVDEDEPMRGTSIRMLYAVRP
jgi:FkbM family methyltransferase